MYCPIFVTAAWLICEDSIIVHSSVHIRLQSERGWRLGRPAKTTGPIYITWLYLAKLECSSPYRPATGYVNNELWVCGFWDWYRCCCNCTTVPSTLTWRSHYTRHVKYLGPYLLTYLFSNVGIADAKSQTLHSKVEWKIESQRSQMRTVLLHKKSTISVVTHTHTHTHSVCV